MMESHVVQASGLEHSPRGYNPWQLSLSDIECPICLSVLEDPFVTTCGHTFCYTCISTHIQTKKNCPCCSAYISKDHTFPNFLLSKVILKATPHISRVQPLEHLQSVLADDKFQCTVDDINSLIEVLTEKKRVLEQRESDSNLELLLQFLNYSREEKAKRLQLLQDELSCLEQDITAVQSKALPGLGVGRSDSSSNLVELKALPEGSGGQGCTSIKDDSHPLACGLQGDGVPSAAHLANSVLSLQAPARSTAKQVAQPQPAPPPGASTDVPRNTVAARCNTALPQNGKHCAVELPRDRCDDEHSSAEPTHRAKRQRIAAQFDDLQQCYLKLQSQRLEQQSWRRASAQSHNLDLPQVDEFDLPSSLPSSLTERLKSNAEAGPSANGERSEIGAVCEDNGLLEFSRMLNVITSCSRLQVVGEIRAANSRHATSILSSIEFDRDGELFATGGVGKRITVFNFNDVMQMTGTDVHPPLTEIVTRSKLTNLSWNSYIKAHLISSDYEGVVSLWDIMTSKTVMEYEAHEKRIWSVDFCRADPMAFVSGSDDGWVKVWSTKHPSSVADIDVKANVCSVEYNPQFGHEIVVGSADHHVHVYDLRQLKHPVHLFAGHRKAVSYVRYMTATEVASASTDGTLRLWSLQTGQAMRTFSGHVNEKNFVGMTANEEFLACGSETNEVHVYFKQVCQPIAKRLFSTAPGSSEDVGVTIDGQFISAVNWQPNSKLLVAANCQGFIKVMKLCDV